METFEYSYFALPGVKLQSLAMCEVEGGPSYESEFVAESSVIKFAVEPQLIELGHMAYNRVVDKEVVVVNQGKVPFSFRVNLDTLSRSSVVADCSSLGGTIAAGGREILKLKVTPGIPDKIDEIIAVEVAHFEPVNVHVKINGLHPSILLSLPRVYDEFYRTAVEQASIILGRRVRSGYVRSGAEMNRALRRGGGPSRLALSSFRGTGAVPLVPPHS